MKKILFILIAALTSFFPICAKTLIAYYSFRGHSRTIATEISIQLTDADVIEIQPSEEGLDYEANNYALGHSLITAINNNPGNASSYPAIKEVNVNFTQYDEIVIATPLWYSHMAAPMQTFLFHNGDKMVNKKIGLIVSSASSNPSGVVNDAIRLIPNGIFVPRLWITSSQTSNCQSLVADWISANKIGTSGINTVYEDNAPTITILNRHLHINGNFSRISLHDINGKLVILSSTNDTDISALTSGIYIATVKHTGKSYSTKISLQ